MELIDNIVSKCNKLKDRESNLEMLEYMYRNAANHNMWDASIKDYIHGDSMSFRLEVDKLNEKYISISNKIANKKLIEEISEITTYFEEWDMGDDESAHCKNLGNSLLEVIDRSQRKNTVKSKIDDMFPIIHVSRDIWRLSSIKILFYTGFFIFSIVEEADLRVEAYERLKILLHWVFANKNKFYNTYEAKYMTCIDTIPYPARTRPVWTVNFKIFPVPALMATLQGGG